MEKIIIKTATRSSEIAVGEKWTNLGHYLPAGQVVIITDNNLRSHYGNRFPDFPVISVEPGEGSKSLDTVEKITLQLLNLGIDRSGFILAIGGGVVCDLAGFVASVYMRGVKFGFVSSSLLSQIDASVGGKNGVNCGQIKNVIGTFSQPEFVICDPAMLATLPEDEYVSGLAEMIKIAAIMDEPLLELIETNKQRIFDRGEKALETLIARSVSLKAAVVAEDEKEAGRRMILNFGHTFGHVIEAVTSMKHGFAVANGMLLAAGISVEEGLLEKKEFERLKKILIDFNLLQRYELPATVLLEKISADKKKHGDVINFVLAGPLGTAVVRKKEIMKLVNYFESNSLVK